jgi:hypothetical protein
LERERGFTRLVIRTDYEFASVAEAVALIGFFFGDEVAALVERRDTPVVPEWTGVWFKAKAALRRRPKGR